MGLKSRVYMGELIDNKLKRLGAANQYYPMWVVDGDDEYHFGLLTKRELEMAVKRGKNNPEDEIPPYSMKTKIVKWFKSFYND